MKSVRIVAVVGMVIALALYAMPTAAQGPDNWQDYVIFMDTFQGGPSDAWEVTGGWGVEQAGNASIFLARAPGAAWVSGGSEWTDYIVRLAARLDNGTLALSFRWTDAGRYVLQYWDDGLYLTKESPQGTFTTLTETAAPALGAWHVITVACDGGDIQVYVDQQLALYYTDPAPLTQGTIGVGALDDTLTAITNVIVMELLHPLSPVAPPPIQPGGPGGEPSGDGASDVAITDVMLSNSNPAEGEIITVWTTVASVGSAAAENFDLVIIPTYTSAGPNNPGAFRPISSLAPGEEITIETNVMYGSAGHYTLRALATDDWQLTGNAEVGGNRQWDVPVTVGQPETGGGQPDILLSATSANYMGSPPGAVAVNYSVYNAGSVDAGAFTVRWYPHGRTEVVGCSEDIMLAAGETRDLTCLYHYETHGEMHWRVVVDADNDIAESNEGNNEYRGTVQVDQGTGTPGTGKPDIIISDVSAIPTESPAGGVSITITVHNAGNADAGAFTVRWYPHGQSDVVGCSEDLPGLAAGASQWVRCFYSYENHGEMHWRVIVDADDDLAELNEDNNVYNGTVLISSGAGPAEAADLTITEVSTNVTTDRRSVNITISVFNVGNVDAGPFTVRWYPHAQSDEVGCSEDISLAAGDAQWVRCLYTYPNHGEMHWRAVVDADNDIREQNENDNEFRGSVSIPQ